MAYRFTDTNKWSDAWFCEIKLLNKALFLYLCDQCDIAGFLEINAKKISFDLGIGKQEVEGALKGLERSVLFSADKRFLFLKNFIKHQKNLPLNENNKAHLGIIKRLEENLKLFNFQSVDDYFCSPYEGASKGLPSPTGIGIGKGIGSISSIISIKSSGSFGATAPAQPKKSKEELKSEMDKRANDFGKLLIPFTDTYGKEMVRAFYDYWTEPNKSGTKMRFEMERTWELSRRLATWASREPLKKQSYGQTQQQGQQAPEYYTPRAPRL